MRTQHGFTLVELSISLLVIGLLIGGVMVGRDMIKSAQMRSVVSQLDSYTGAMRTFELKYGYLPGDIPPSIAGKNGLFTLTNANTDWDGASTANTYGNGDGTATAGVRAYLFSADAAGYARREEPGWRAWLQELSVTA